MNNKESQLLFAPIIGGLYLFNCGLIPGGLLFSGLMSSGLIFGGLRSGDHDVRWAAVRWAAVQWAAVRWADVRLAAVRWADVRWAAVRWADVQWAALQWAAVRWADIRWAAVRWADVRWAAARWADVRWAALHWVNVRAARSLCHTLPVMTHSGVVTATIRHGRVHSAPACYANLQRQSGEICTADAAVRFRAAGPPALVTPSYITAACQRGWLPAADRRASLKRERCPLGPQSYCCDENGPG